jgi:putative peptidoglycan lipid II flippase
MTERSPGLGAASIPPSEDGAFARGAFAVSAFALVGAAARLALDVAIAWRHGTDPVVDAYFFVLGVLNWPLAFALSTLTLLLVPAEAALRHSLPDGVRALRAALLGRALLISAGALPLGWWLLHLVLSSGATGLDPASTHAATTGLPWIAAALPLGLVAALLTAWLVASGRHAVTLLEALPAVLLTVLIVAGPSPALFWGTTLGIGVQVSAMAWLLRRHSELPLPSLRIATEGHGLLRSGVAALVTAQLLFTLVPVIDPLFASHLGDGVVALMGYANRLILGLQGLAGLAMQRAGLPLLSRMMAREVATARRVAWRWAVVAGLGGSAAALGLALLADPVVQLMYERGSFTAQDSEAVTQLLRYGLLQMPPFLVGASLVAALAAARQHGALALAGCIGLLVKLLASAALVELLGARGLMIATALMYSATALVAALALTRRLRL